MDCKLFYIKYCNNSVVIYSIWSFDDFINNKKNDKGGNEMINLIEKTLEFLDEVLPVILAPIAIVLFIRIIYQILTY